MLIYKTPTGGIPEEVRQAWQEFAVDYARREKLGTVEDPEAWEVPDIILSAFPSVGLLLYQYPKGNQNGNCGKVVVEAGSEDIALMESKLGNLPGCIEVKYNGGMGVPLHSHPKLVFNSDGKFKGSVVSELGTEGQRVYRVRVVEGRQVHSDIYAEQALPAGVKNIFSRPTGILAAEFVEREATFDIADLAGSGYPTRLNDNTLREARPRKEYNPRDTSVSSIRVGKQEQFTGLGDILMYIGGKGDENLSKQGLVLPYGLEENVDQTHRHVYQLQKGMTTPPVKWHWLMAGKQTATVGEISGMPHLGQGSIDGGDLFYRCNRAEDPLFVKYLRTSVLGGH